VTKRLPLRATLAVVAGVATTVVAVSLGNWQTRRGDSREAAQATWDAAERAAPLAIGSRDDGLLLQQTVPVRVSMRGEFLAGATVFVDNRPLNGAAGFQVVTPLRVAKDLTVLVNRGWLPRDAGDPLRIPALQTPKGPVTVEGLAVARVPRLMELAPAQSLALPGIWPNLEFDEYERAAAMKVPRVVVQQTNDINDGLRREWVRPVTGVERHRGYALQWYGLALLAAGLTLYFGGRALRGAGR
jgi:cytochrome oxidase assembly protein ShyY1